MTESTPPTTAAAEHEGPIEFVRDGLERVRLYSGHDLAKMPATAADLIACLTANPQLRAAVLGAIDTEAEWRGLAEKRGLELAQQCSELHEAIDSKSAGWALAKSRLEALEAATEKLRLAESGLAAERARVRRASEIVSSWQGRVPYPLRESIRELAELLASQQSAALPRWHCPKCGASDLDEVFDQSAPPPAQSKRRPECPHGVGLCTALCPSKDSVAYWQRTEHGCRSDDGATCVLCQRDMSAPPPAEQHDGLRGGEKGDEYACPDCDFVGWLPHFCPVKPTDGGGASPGEAKCKYCNRVGCESEKYRDDSRLLRMCRHAVQLERDFLQNRVGRVERALERLQEAAKAGKP